MFLLLPGIEPRLIGLPNRIVDTALTELFRFPVSQAYEYECKNVSFGLCFVLRERCVRCRLTDV